MIGLHISQTKLKNVKEKSKILTLKNKVHQIFLGSPLSYTITSIDKKYLENVYVHSKYIGNILKSKKKIDSIKEELDVGSKGVVLHLYRETNDRTKDCEKTVKIIKKNFNVPELLIETPDNNIFLGARFDDLILFKKLNVNFCIDTAHVHLTNFNIYGTANLMNYFALFVSKIGLERIKLIHLNGCKTTRQHFPISDCNNLTEGSISFLLSFCKNFNIDIILERSKEKNDKVINEELNSLLVKFSDVNFKDFKTKFLNLLIEKFYRKYYTLTFDEKYLHLYKNLDLLSFDKQIHIDNIEYIKKNYTDIFKIDKVDLDISLHSFSRSEIKNFIEELKSKNLIFYIVGSYARDEENINDLDFLIESSMIDLFLDSLDYYLKTNGMLRKEIIYKLKTKNLKIDLFIYDKVSAEQIIIYTLTKESRIGLANKAKNKGWLLNDKGLYNEKGKEIKFKSKEELKSKLSQ